MKPFARTTAVAPLSPSAAPSFCVKAGSGAAWVLVGACAPPFVVACAGVVLCGVVAVEVVSVVVGAFVPVVCVTVGVPATDTVLVAEPHPPSSAPPDTPRTTATSAETLLVIVCMLFAASVGSPRFAERDRPLPRRARCQRRLRKDGGEAAS